MKKIILLFLLFIVSQVKAQESYGRENDIPYYPISIGFNDQEGRDLCVLDIYYPKILKNYSTVIWFHGGGLTSGKKEIPQELLEKGYAVIGVGYRLSPKANAPAYINDAAAAVAWAFKHLEKYGGSPRKIFLSGHSAGGYLAMMVTLDKKYLAKYGIDANKIAGLIPFSGQCITHFTVRHERGIRDTQPVIDDYAPLYWVRADAPPTLLITGDAELELLGRYEENAYMLRMMKLAGSKSTRLFQLQGFDHGNMAVPAFPLLIKEIAERQKQIK